MKIINLFGGPGCGKSTLASYIFSQLKLMGRYNVELLSEYAKYCVYEDRIDLLKNDQLYVFAKQNHKLVMIKNYKESPDFVITDSPILLSNIYGKINNSISNKFEEFVIETFNSYENINYFINRSFFMDFQSSGRIQSEDESKRIDYMIKNYLIEKDFDFETVENDDLQKAYDFIMRSRQLSRSIIKNIIKK